MDEIAEKSIYAIGVGKITQEYCSDLFFKKMISGSILELGPAEGVMTDLLYKNKDSFRVWSNNSKYTIVEGSSRFCSIISKKYPEIEVFESMFEDFDTNYKYDNIVLGHVLEHVDNPELILSRCKDWLSSKGRILVAVPNANSIHRQAAVKMGLLENVYCFSEKDKRHGHKRIFDMESLKKCFVDSGLSIIEEGGYWLKPLADSQIEETWNESMVNAFLKLGEEYPDIAGEIYIVASL